MDGNGVRKAGSEPPASREQHHRVRAALGDGLVRAVASTVGVVLGVVAVGPFVVGRMLFPTAGSDSSAGRRAPGYARQVEQLVRVHGCWTRHAPADMVGMIPGHVVATRPGDDRPVYSRRLVAAALDQEFDGHEHHLVVYAFCR